MIKDFSGKNASRKTRHTPEKTRFLEEMRFPQIARHEQFLAPLARDLMPLATRLTLAPDPTSSAVLHADWQTTEQP